TVYAALLDGRLLPPPQLAHLSAVAFEGTDQVFGNPARLALGYPLGRIGPPTTSPPTTFAWPGGGRRFASAHPPTPPTHPPPHIRPPPTPPRPPPPAPPPPRPRQQSVVPRRYDPAVLAGIDEADGPSRWVAKLLRELAVAREEQDGYEIDEVGLLHDGEVDE